MSELTNRAAYLKGLADGMKLDKEKDEAKLLSAIIDFLGDVAEEIQALDDEQGFIADVIDDIEEDIDTICDEIFDEYDEDWECTECGALLHRDYGEDEYSIVEDDFDGDEEDEEESEEDSGYSSFSYSPENSSSLSQRNNSYRTYQAQGSSVSW